MHPVPISDVGFAIAGPRPGPSATPGLQLVTIRGAESARRCRQLRALLDPHSAPCSGAGAGRGGIEIITVDGARFAQPAPGTRLGERRT